MDGSRDAWHSLMEVENKDTLKLARRPNGRMELLEHEYIVHFQRH
jgi:hypothetical protein